MRSDAITKGVACAPQRSLLHALGMTDEEMQKPMIGIVSSYNEIVPGHMNIDKIVEAVKTGVAMAGNTPSLPATLLPTPPSQWLSLTRLTLSSWFPTATRTSPVCSWRRQDSTFPVSSSAAAPCSRADSPVTKPASPPCSRLSAPTTPASSPPRSSTSMRTRLVPAAAPARVCTPQTQ